MKNLIILPDGTEIFSGDREVTNIRSTYLKQCVNSETELTLGSVCASILECKIQTPNGALNLAAGTEVTLYKVDDSGIRHKVGPFTLEKPTRPSAHTYKITAYDRISWLDKDLTEWLTSLDGWPYSVFDFAHMVAAQCGLVLKNTSLLNGSYQIQKFTGQGITGRRLMEWIGQICAKFCRATPDGEIEFAWYARKYNIEIAPSAYTREGVDYEVSFVDGKLTINSSAVSSAAAEGAGGGDTLINPFDITSWGGTPPDEACYFEGLYRVSNRIPTIEDFANGMTITFLNPSTEEETSYSQTADAITETDDGAIVFADGMMIVIPKNNAQGVLGGIYSQVSFQLLTLTIPGYTGFPSSEPGGSIAVEGLVVVSDDGDGHVVVAVDDGARTGLPFFANSLTFEDYETAPIERVRIQLTDDDVGVVYPDMAGNTYDITGNYLLTADDPSALQSVAEGVYNAVCNIRYTPCEVSIAANLGICAGDIVTVTDRNGKTFTTCVMTRTQRGQRDTLECTGSPRRDSSTAANNESLKAFNAKMLEVRKSIDGLSVKATALEQKVDTTTEQTRSQIAQVDIKANGLFASVQEVQQQVDTAKGKADQNAEEIRQTRESITKIEAAAGEVSIQVQKIIDNGVTRVETPMGYTFNDEGLHIQKPGGDMLNRLDDEGMEVSRSGETMLRADKDGVLATDVTVRNYLNMGKHARFEDYSNGTDTKRTACFWIDD